LESVLSRCTASERSASSSGITTNVSPLFPGGGEHEDFRQAKCANYIYVVKSVSGNDLTLATTKHASPIHGRVLQIGAEGVALAGVVGRGCGHANFHCSAIP
jgi:hypothetical protein